MPTAPQTVNAGAPDESPRLHQPSESSLIYLATPFSHPNSEVRRSRVDQVNVYAAHLLSGGILAFSPLSHGAPLDSPDIPSSVWYELGLRIMEG